MGTRYVCVKTASAEKRFSFKDDLQYVEQSCSCKDDLCGTEQRCTFQDDL
jgi:hypothetical protein